MVTLSAAFATTLETPDHVRVAEQLGYGRAWLYDTPQQSPDVWLALALAAERTETIGLGPGVLVPSLRHPMVNAAGAAALATLAPGRAAVAFGTGYTGRRAMGQKKPIPWSYMSDYITAFRGLLAGETVTWEGAALRMLHPPAASPPPIEIPIYIGAIGPKGLEVAQRLGDGIFITSGIPDAVGGFADVAMLAWGTVLDPGEPIDSERVRLTAGPGLAQTFHAYYEFAGDAVADLPGGREWLDVIDGADEAERHLVVHRDHCLQLNEADSAAWAAGAHALVETSTLTGTADQVARRVGELAGQGVTEIVYQPAGDIPAELERFQAAVSDQISG